MVVAVLPDAGMRARLADAARRLGERVQFVATYDEARAALAPGGARAVVVAARDARGLPGDAFVAWACAGHPRAAVVGYCALARGDPSASAAMVGLVRAGAHTVVVWDVDDGPHALQVAMRGAEQRVASREVLTALGDALPPTVRAVVAVYLRNDDAPPSVVQVAASLGVHRRTLVNRMRAAGCPPPRALRTWCRVFVAAYLLEEPARTVESVALPLGFESTTGLRNALRRYTGLAPQALRGAGGLRCALAAFACACERRRTGFRRGARAATPGALGGRPGPAVDP